MTGRITQLIRSRACGFIRAADGQVVFFHASELHGVRFDQLEDCLTVRFDLIHDAVSGPRAGRVRIDRGVAANGSARRKTGARGFGAAGDQS